MKSKKITNMPFYLSNVIKPVFDLQTIVFRYSPSLVIENRKQKTIGQ